MYVIHSQFEDKKIIAHLNNTILNDPFLSLLFCWRDWSKWTFINLPGWCSAEGAAPSEKTAAFKRWKCDVFACALTEKITPASILEGKKSVRGLDVLTVIQVTLLGCRLGFRDETPCSASEFQAPNTHGCFTLSCLSPAPADNKSPPFTVLRQRKAQRKRVCV